MRYFPFFLFFIIFTIVSCNKDSFTLCKSSRCQAYTFQPSFLKVMEPGNHQWFFFSGSDLHNIDFMKDGAIPMYYNFQQGRLFVKQQGLHGFSLSLYEGKKETKTRELAPHVVSVDSVCSTDTDVWILLASVCSKTHEKIHVLVKSDTSLERWDRYLLFREYSQVDHITRAFLSDLREVPFSLMCDKSSVYLQTLLYYTGMIKLNIYGFDSESAMISHVTSYFPLTDGNVRAFYDGQSESLLLYQNQRYVEQHGLEFSKEKNGFLPGDAIFGVNDGKVKILHVDSDDGKTKPAARIIN